jgi:hypothetical protein
MTVNMLDSGFRECVVAKNGIVAIQYFRLEVEQ